MLHYRVHVTWEIGFVAERKSLAISDQRHKVVLWFLSVIIIIIICYIYIARFYKLKVLYIEGGESPHPPPVYSIHLDEATAAIVHQNAPHTPAYWWKGDSDEANQCMGMIRRSWWSEANGEIWPGCRGYTPTLFGLMSHTKYVCHLYCSFMTNWTYEQFNKLMLLLNWI